MAAIDAIETKALANSLDSLAQQLTTVAETIHTGSASLDSLKDERARVVNAAEALLKDLKPADPVLASMINMVQFTAIRLFVDWGAFDIISSAGTISYVDLAEKMDADVSLVGEYLPFLDRTWLTWQCDSLLYSSPQVF